MRGAAALKSSLTAAGIACLLGSPQTVHAQSQAPATAIQAEAAPRSPQVRYDLASAPPPIPAGLKVACVKVPDDGYQASKTCPVIYYGDTITWIYSFVDNRASFALVTYDGNGRILQNVTHDGARYAFDAISDDRGQKITIVGQAKQFITINWSDLPH
jgi:hypothetical protein